MLKESASLSGLFGRSGLFSLFCLSRVNFG